MPLNLQKTWITFLPTEWDSLVEHFKSNHLLLVFKTWGISLHRCHQDTCVSCLEGSWRLSFRCRRSQSHRVPLSALPCLLAPWRECIFFPVSVCSLFVASADSFDRRWKHWTGQWGPSETDRREWDWWAIPSKIFAAHNLGREPKWWSRLN